MARLLRRFELSKPDEKAAFGGKIISKIWALEE